MLRAVAHARSVQEQIGGMSSALAAHEKLTPDEQIFVTVNLERTGRGLPAMKLLNIK